MISAPGSLPNFGLTMPTTTVPTFAPMAPDMLNLSFLQRTMPAQKKAAGMSVKGAFAPSAAANSLGVRDLVARALGGLKF